MTSPLELSRAQILAFRRRVGALDGRLEPGEVSLRRAAWAGLQDSMPRAAILSIHARVQGTGPDVLDDPALAQVWGPRFSAYVVPALDVAVFTLGRFPDDARGRRVAVDTAERLHTFLDGRTMPYGAIGEAMGVVANSLRYATTTGRVLIRWDGARQPTIWTVPPPEMEPRDARLELARRYLHVFGPSTSRSFAGWAGIGPREAGSAFDGLRPELLSARTPIGDGWILAADESAFLAPTGPAVGARLLPSGDSYFLLQGAERELLVPEQDRRSLLWTPRAWPGALLVDGEIAGTWRRAGSTVDVQAWAKLAPAAREAAEAEVAALPLPGLGGGPSVRWSI